jgi:hypothetical protein
MTWCTKANYLFFAGKRLITCASDHLVSASINGVAEAV